MINENPNSAGSQATRESTTEVFESFQIEEGKTMALVAYLTIIGLVIALVMNSDKRNNFVKFHIRQSLGLMLTGLAVSFVSWIPFLGWIVGVVAMIVLLIMWIAGIMNAVNGKAKYLPFLGAMYAEWFKSL